MKKVLITISLMAIIKAGQSQTIRDSIPKKKLFVITDSMNFEKEPEFNGGINEWNKYLSQNINGDIPRINKAPAGTYKVIVKFAIDKDGAVTNVTTTTYNGYGMEEEVIRVVKASPLWIPAYQNRKNVMAYRMQTIAFTVN